MHVEGVWTEMNQEEELSVMKATIVCAKFILLLSLFIAKIHLC